MAGAVVKYIDDFAQIVGSSLAHTAPELLTQRKVATHFKSFFEGRSGPLNLSDFRKWYDEALKNDEFKDILSNSGVRRSLENVAENQINRQNFDIEFRSLLSKGDVDERRINLLGAAYKLRQNDSAILAARVEANLKRQGLLGSAPPVRQAEAAPPAGSTTARTADDATAGGSTTARTADDATAAGSTTARTADDATAGGSTTARTADDASPLRTAATIPAKLKDGLVPSFTGDLGNLMNALFTQRFSQIAEEAMNRAKSAGLKFEEQHAKYMEALTQQQAKYSAVISDMRRTLGDGETLDSAAFMRWYEEAAKKGDFADVLGNPEIRNGVVRLIDNVAETQARRKAFITAYNERLANTSLGDVERTFAGDLQKKFNLDDGDMAVVEARRIYDDVAKHAGLSADEAANKWARAGQSADEAVGGGGDAAVTGGKTVGRPAGDNGQRVMRANYEDWLHKLAGYHPSHWGYALFPKMWQNWGLGSLKLSLPSIAKFTMAHMIRPAINHVDGLLKKTGVMDEVIGLQGELNAIAKRMGSSNGLDAISPEAAKLQLQSVMNSFYSRNSGKIDEAVTGINKMLDELNDGESVLLGKKYTGGLTGLTERQAENMRRWLEDLRDTLQKTRPVRESTQSLADGFKSTLDRVARMDGANGDVINELRSAVSRLDLTADDSATLIKTCEDEITRIVGAYGNDTVGLKELRDALTKMKTEADKPSALAKTYIDEIDRIAKAYGNDTRGAAADLELILHSRFSRLGSDVKLRLDDVVIGLDGKPAITPKGDPVLASVWRTKVLERQLLAGTYNRQDRALKFLTSDTEHNLELRAHELLHYYERNAPRAVNVEPKNEFFAMVQSFYDAGLEQEAVRIIRILKSKMGAAAQDTLPKGFEGVVRDAMRVEANPHRKQFYEDLLGAAMFELDTGRKWGAREVERKFVAPLSEFWYMAEAFPLRGGKGSMGTGYSVPTVDNYLRYPLRNMGTEIVAYLTGGQTKMAPGWKRGEFVIDDADKLRARFDYTLLYRRPEEEGFRYSQGFWGRERSLGGILGKDGIADRMPWFVKMPARLISGGMLSAESKIGLSLPGKVLAGGALTTWGVEKGTAALGWNDGEGYKMPVTATVLAAGASLRNPLLLNKIFMGTTAGIFGLETAAHSVGLTDGGYVDPRGPIHFLQSAGIGFFDIVADDIPKFVSGDRFTGLDLDTGRIGPWFKGGTDVDIKSWILSWTDRGPERKRQYEQWATEAEDLKNRIGTSIVNTTNIHQATKILLEDLGKEVTAARGRGENDKARQLEELRQKIEAEWKVIDDIVLTQLPKLQSDARDAFSDFKDSNGNIVDAEEALTDLRNVNTRLTQLQTEANTRQNNMRSQLAAAPAAVKAEADSVLRNVPTAPAVAVPPTPGAPVVPPAPGTAAVPPAPGTAAVPPAPGTAAVPPAPGTAAVPPAPGTAASGPAYIGQPSGQSTTTGTPEQQLTAIKAEGDRAAREIRDDVNNTSQQAQYANDTVRQLLELQEQARNNNGNPAYFEPALVEARLRSQEANQALQQVQEAARLSESGIQDIKAATVANLEVARSKLVEAQTQARAAREAQQKASRAADNLRRVIESNTQIADMIHDRTQRQRVDSITGALEGGNNGPISNLLRDRGQPGGQSYLGQMFNAVGNAFSGVRDWWTRDVARAASRSEGGKMLYQGANIGLGVIAGLMGVSLWNSTFGEWTGTKISGGLKLLVVGGALLWMLRGSSALGDKLDKMGGRYTATGNDYNMGSGAVGPSPFTASTAPVTDINGNVTQRGFLGMDTQGRTVGHEQEGVFRASADGRPRTEAAATMGEMSHVPSEAADVFGRAHNVRSDDNGTPKASVYDFVNGGQNTALAYAH